MAEVKFIPKVCTDQTDEKTGEVIKARFTGHVILRKPTFDEKYGYLQESGLTLGEDGKPQEISGSMERISFIRKVVALSKKHYLSVCLERISDGAKIESLDDLETAGDCDDILIEIGTKILSGFAVGNG